jgi:hypothetical protein
MRTEYAPPKGFKPLSEQHAASVAFIQKLGLEAVFPKSPEVEQAVRILRRHRSRELVEAALVVAVRIGTACR